MYVGPIVAGEMYVGSIVARGRVGHTVHGECLDTSQRHYELAKAIAFSGGTLSKLAFRPSWVLSESRRWEPNLRFQSASIARVAGYILVCLAGRARGGLGRLSTWPRRGRLPSVGSVSSISHALVVLQSR